MLGAVRGARRDQSKAGDHGEKERDQHIVTGKRQSEKTPRGLVTAHDMNAMQLVEQRSAATQIGERARTVGRAGPPMPFHA